MASGRFAVGDSESAFAAKVILHDEVDELLSLFTRQLFLVQVDNLVVVPCNDDDEHVKQRDDEKRHGRPSMHIVPSQETKCWQVDDQEREEAVPPNQAGLITSQIERHDAVCRRHLVNRPHFGQKDARDLHVAIDLEQEDREAQNDRNDRIQHVNSPLRSIDGRYPLIERFRHFSN